MSVVPVKPAVPAESGDEEEARVRMIRLYSRTELARSLLYEVVRPVLLDAGEHLEQHGFHVRRHWLGGPHIQFGWLAKNADAPPAPVEELVGRSADWIAARLQGRPDGEYPSEATWLETSRALGRQELVPPPYEPMFAEGSRIDTQDDRLIATQIGGASVQQMRARALGRLGREVLRVTPSPDAGRQQRMIVTLNVLVSLAAGYPSGGLRHGYLSLRSHAEDHLFDHDRDGTTRRDWEPIIERLSAAVQPAVDRRLGDHEPNASVQQGHLDVAVAEVYTEILGLAEGGDIHVLLPWEYVDRAAELGDDLRRKWRAGDDREYSDFHTSLRGLNFDDPIEGNYFAAYRYLTAIAYEQLGLIGISPAERVICSLAISDAVERSTATTWKDIFGKGMA